MATLSQSGFQRLFNASYHDIDMSQPTLQPLNKIGMANPPDKAPLRHNRHKKKGVKATRGRPLLYDEVKQKKWYTLTPSVIEVIRKRAEHLGLTESEALERLIRVIALLPLPDDEAL